MSYYFGFTLEAHSILVSDQKRSEYHTDGTVRNFLQTKIWKIRDDLYVTGAGNLSFAEDCVLKAVPQVIKDKVLDLNDLAAGLGEWAEYFERNYRILEENSRPINQLRDKHLDSALQDDTCVMLAGIDQRGTPFLLDFHSLNNFKGDLSVGLFKARLLGLCPEGVALKDAEQLQNRMTNAVKRRLETLANMKYELERIKRATKIMPEIIAMAAKEDNFVSREYDLVVVGPTGPRLFNGRS